MKNPKCPSCNQDISIFQSFKIYNPWNIRCSNCETALEGGKWQKISLLPALLIGGCIAVVAIHQEEAGNWQTSDSLIWFGVSFLFLFLIWLPFWPKYTYKIKLNAKPLKPKKKYTKTQIILITILSVLALGIAYWEFTYDIKPTEAFEYYSQIHLVAYEENAAFDFAGIAAPDGTEDLHDWGETQVALNMERFFNGEEQIRILKDTPSEEGWMYLDLPEEEHFECWVPRSNWADKNKNCIDETQVRSVLERNKVLIDRYKKVFDQQLYEDEFYYEVGFGQSIPLSRLLIIGYWLNRNTLSDEDIAVIFKFFHFWENLSRNVSLTGVDKAVSVVNYGLVSSLIASLSEEDPRILDRYHEEHGQFLTTKTGQEELDNLIKAEFKYFNTRIGLIYDYEEKWSPCDYDKSLTFKPGRTLDFLFEKRPKIADCKTSEDEEPNSIDLGVWSTVFDIFKRPGNSKGRELAYTVMGGMLNGCTIFEHIDLEIEENELRNLYLYFRENSYSPDQITDAYKIDKELFRIAGTSRYFVWDEPNNLLVWEGIKPDQNYKIPYL